MPWQARFIAHTTSAFSACTHALPVHARTSCALAVAPAALNTTQHIHQVKCLSTTPTTPRHSAYVTSNLNNLRNAR